MTRDIYGLENCTSWDILVTLLLMCCTINHIECCRFGDDDDADVSLCIVAGDVA